DLESCDGVQQEELPPLPSLSYPRLLNKPVLPAIPGVYLLNKPVLPAITNIERHSSIPEPKVPVLRGATRRIGRNGDLPIPPRGPASVQIPLVAPWGDQVDGAGAVPGQESVGRKRGPAGATASHTERPRRNLAGVKAGDTSSSEGAARDLAGVKAGDTSSSESAARDLAGVKVGDTLHPERPRVDQTGTKRNLLEPPSIGDNGSAADLQRTGVCIPLNRKVARDGPARLRQHGRQDSVNPGCVVAQDLVEHLAPHANAGAGSR